MDGWSGSTAPNHVSAPPSPRDGEGPGMGAPQPMRTRAGRTFENAFVRASFESVQRLPLSRNAGLHCERMRRALWLLALCATLSCTDSSLYSLGGGGKHPPDRVDMTGTVCAPVAAGRYFPVRVLFMFVGGDGVLSDVKAAFATAAQNVTQRSTNPAIRYGLAAFHSTAQGEIDQGFGDAAALNVGLVRY